MGMMGNALLLLLFVAVGSVDLCLGQNPTAMYVFGDSLVDVGNNNYLKLSIAKADFPRNGIDFTTNKSTGRFCNGKNAADFLAEKIGFASSPPPYFSLKNSKPKSNDTPIFPITGVSFASGSARIFNSTNYFTQAIPLTQQVEYFRIVKKDLFQQLRSADAQQHLSRALFTIIIGSNDIFNYPGSSYSKTMTPEQYVDKMNINFEVQIKRLYDEGARKFNIAGVGALGCCPSKRILNKTRDCKEAQNAMAREYNQGLKSMLQNLKSQLTDFNYSYLEVYTIFENILQSPSVYGFSEIKAACCGLGYLNAQVPCLPFSSYCANRNDYLFWDLYHPTEKTFQILIDFFFHGKDPIVLPMNVNQLIHL